MNKKGKFRCSTMKHKSRHKEATDRLRSEQKRLKRKEKQDRKQLNKLTEEDKMIKELRRDAKYLESRMRGIF